MGICSQCVFGLFPPSLRWCIGSMISVLARSASFVMVRYVYIYKLDGIAVLISLCASYVCDIVRGYLKPNHNLDYTLYLSSSW